ncbi:MAG: hypothetical protein KAT23_10635, partial [Anaerolineales bacterium]|nr:hypothetical protein [Anaerolineales bacterium]
GGSAVGGSDVDVGGSAVAGGVSVSNGGSTSVAAGVAVDGKLQASILATSRIAQTKGIFLRLMEPPVSSI